MPINSANIGQPSGMPEGVQILPIIQPYTDIYSSESGFIGDDVQANGALSAFHHGGGLVQASFYYPGGLSSVQPLIASLFGSHDLIHWFTVHSQISIYPNAAYPNRTVTVGGRAVDLPIRYFYWAWKVHQYPADAPENQIVIVSAICRPTSGTISEISAEAF